MTRTLQEIQGDEPESRLLLDLVSVLQTKLELRARYSLLEYDAAQEGRSDWSELIRRLSCSERAQIDSLCAVLAVDMDARAHAATAERRGGAEGRSRRHGDSGSGAT